MTDLADGGGTMKSTVRNEFGVLVVVGRSISKPTRTHCGFERKLTHEKATRLQPPAGGCPWSRWMARRRLSASVGP